MIAYLFGSKSNISVSNICSGSWIEWNSLGNPNPGNYDFNCIHSMADINNNASNNGYKVGGLNCNGIMVAICYIQNDGVVGALRAWRLLMLFGVIWSFP